MKSILASALLGVAFAAILLSTAMPAGAAPIGCVDAVYMCVVDEYSPYEGYGILCVDGPNGGHACVCHFFGPTDDKSADLPCALG